MMKERHYWTEAWVKRMVTEWSVQAVQCVHLSIRKSPPQMIPDTIGPS
jgi:hypothetical protein